MACMEHYCAGCGWIGFNNDLGPSRCPRCAGPVSHFWDEEGDHARGAYSKYAEREYDARHGSEDADE